MSPLSLRSLGTPGSAATSSETSLGPETGVRLATRGGAIYLEPSSVSPAVVGQKAYGLACIPRAWTKPFIVIPHGAQPNEATLRVALEQEGINPSTRLILRSSGTEETLRHRGSLESVALSLADVGLHLSRLESQTLEQIGREAIVHWVLQEFVETTAKGHLSNERRVAEDKRDWVAEVEASDTHSTEGHRISLRKWRDSAPFSTRPLNCPYRQMYADVLKNVAKWAYLRLLRIHFEWVLDGKRIYIVQADVCDVEEPGLNPAALVKSLQQPSSPPKGLQAFRIAADSDFREYRKLANAQMYRELGYDAIPFYVLNDSSLVEQLLTSGECPSILAGDLDSLVLRPLVIRTDGRSIPPNCRQMLPRSEELRTVAEAMAWLKQFRQKCIEIAGSPETAVNWQLCLIAHHFLPAVSAAWCQARPGQRRVRIESLWGLPEGLYWYAYDAFDVDTQVTDVREDSTPPENLPFREKRRFKEHFIAPNAEGRWVVQRSASGPDWQRSITRAEWIREIAWTSRKIAQRAGTPVVVMWFIGIPKSVSTKNVLPWYHEQWHADNSPYKAAPRRKLSQSVEFTIKDRTGWQELRHRVSVGSPIARVRVLPTEPELVRDPEFAKNLGELAKSYSFVVELCGGLLSHVYYMLQRVGCTVECADLDDYATDDLNVQFNKLVRDRVPEVIASRGESVSLLRLQGDALIAALRRKLVEEALEVLDARTNEEISEELADVREVMLEVMRRLAISEADVEQRRKRKAKERGVFDEALMLTRTAVAPSLAMGSLALPERGEGSQSIAGTIEKAVEIPATWDDIQVDRRVDSHGNVERMFTADLPVHAAGFRPSRVTFKLDTLDGADHEMTLELHLDRKSSEIRLRARLINAPMQLELDLGLAAPSVQRR